MREARWAVWTAALCAGAVMTAPPAVANGTLISVDFVYDEGGLSAPCEGDTAASGGVNTNAAGLTFTGQTGPWNALNVGGNNGNNTSVGPSDFLKDGGGNTTKVKFSMGTPAGGGDWRNNYLFPSEFSVGGVKKLRAEMAYLYNGAVTGDHFYWQLAGLNPAGLYKLVVFGFQAANTHTANSEGGVQDAEGDWNWKSLQADEQGKLTGYFYAPAGTPGIYGFQIMEIFSPLEGIMLLVR